MNQQIEELYRLLAEIGELRDNVKEEAERMGCSPFAVRDTTGQFMMMPLVIAESQIRLTLVGLS